MADDLPFLVEYAKSNRATCKGCGSNIGKDVVRIAQQVQSTHFDGVTPQWYHVRCFLGKPSLRLKVSMPEVLSGFLSLRWEDQEDIRKKFDSKPSAGDAKDAAASGGLRKYSAELAKSGKSSCRVCAEKIAANSLRLGSQYKNEMNFTVTGWHHVKCFFEAIADASKEDFAGLDTLDKKEQAAIISYLKAPAPAAETAAKGGKKRKEVEAETEAAEGSKKEEPKRGRKSKKGKTEAEEAVDTAAAELEKENAALREQSQLIWKHRDEILNTHGMKKDHIATLLTSLGYEVGSANQDLLAMWLADALTFGLPPECPDCHGARLVPTEVNYKCSHRTAWAKCDYTTVEPAFECLKKDANWPVLENHKYVARKKIFSRKVIEAREQQAAKRTNQSDEGSKKRPKLSLVDNTDTPFQGLRFLLAGRMSRKQADIVELIKKHGGTVESEFSEDLTAVITTQKEFDGNSTKVTEAKALRIPIWREQYLDTCISKRALLDPKAEWMELFAPQEHAVKEDKIEKEKKVKVTVKGGVAIEDGCTLDAATHQVLRVDNNVYSATLVSADVQESRNSYYKLQIITDDHQRVHYLYRAWGRVGTNIGDNKLEPFYGSRSSAISEFERLFLEKSGNAWADRDRFVKKPRCMNFVQVSYEDENAKKGKTKPALGSTSRLHPRVVDVLKMIFDVEAMKTEMLSMEIDMEKLPLGKLSRSQLQEAYKVLTSLQNLIQEAKDQPPNKLKVMEFTNQFYSLVPHNFGTAAPKMIDSLDTLREKIGMVDALLEMEVATSIMKTSEESEKDPIEEYYERLKTDMEAIDMDSDVAKMIVKYAENTHAPTHSGYKLKVANILKISRHGERERFEPFKDLHNRQLLWHGSRMTNFVGILTTGLRIAPPEAPATGYMFGKGIYFANSASKSANYTFANQSKPFGFMLLSEVALGNMYELTHSQYITTLPDGYHSTKGCGGTAPGDSVTIDNGVVVPMGKLVSNRAKSTSLLYDEFIVYDVAQVNIRYMILFEFQYGR